MNINDIQVGDVFSETSYFTVKRIEDDAVIFKSTVLPDNEVPVANAYVEGFMSTANQYESEEKVTLTKLQEVFANIGNQVFMVNFTKKATKKTKKAIKAEKEALIKGAVDDAMSAISNRRGNREFSVKKANLEAVIQEVVDTPVQEIIPGEDRTLIGYKVQMNTETGLYQCMDMEINQERPVNIRELNWLIYDGVKYTRKK